MDMLRCSIPGHTCYRLTTACHHATVDDLWRCRACWKQITKLHPYLGVRP